LTLSGSELPQPIDPPLQLGRLAVLNLPQQLLELLVVLNSDSRFGFRLRIGGNQFWTAGQERRQNDERTESGSVSSEFSDKHRSRDPRSVEARTHDRVVSVEVITAQKWREKGAGC
jgi:hypothetical protein